MTQLGHFLSIHEPLDQSGVTGGGLDPYHVHALFINMDNMWTERFGNYDCLVNYRSHNFPLILLKKLIHCEKILNSN